MVAIRRSNGGCLKALAADTTVGSKLQDEEDEGEVSDAHSKLPRIGARTALRGIRTALRSASAAPAAHTRHLIGALFLQAAHITSRLKCGNARLLTLSHAPFRSFPARRHL